MPSPSWQGWGVVGLAVVLGVLPLMALSGCERGVSAEMNAVEPPSQEVVRLSFWGSTGEVATMHRLIAEFERSHPAIDIVPMHVPDNYFQKLHIWMAARLAPDVIMMNNLMLPVYANAHQLEDLHPALKSHGVNSRDFYPQTLTALSRGKALYAIPRDVSTLVVFYNKTLLKQLSLAEPRAGWTWPQAIVLGQKVTHRPVRNQKGSPKRYGWSFAKAPPILWLPFVWSWGGGWFAQPDKLLDLKDPLAWQGLRTYVDLRHHHHITPTTTELGNNPPTQLFLQGRLGFLISGRWSVPFMREFAPFDWDVVGFPAGPAGSRVGVDSSGYAISAHSRHKPAAWQVLTWLSSARSQTIFAESGLIVPARQAVARQLLSRETRQGLRPHNGQAFLDAVPTGVPTQTPPDWNEVSETLTQQLTPWFETGQR